MPGSDRGEGGGRVLTATKIQLVILLIKNSTQKHGCRIDNVAHVAYENYKTEIPHAVITCKTDIV